ncbi:uncharacterized protein V1516DRAFT_627815 [Lipomyces oligophaga]|uniref:uncharacterized protein n=1 Tax=Lipomyces oligophaga TaxID=45792 RepID=UPI0034CF7A74
MPTQVPIGSSGTPRYMRLAVVDGRITVIENPFSDDDLGMASEQSPDEDSDNADDDARVIDVADLLVKPASKKRRRQLEDETENNNKSEDISTAAATDEESRQELTDLRGEGRYFGSATPTRERVCFICNQPGHLSSECKLIQCDTCGMKNDHLTRNCPKTRRCTNCNQLDHSAFECKARRRELYCTQCRSSRHTSDTCPSIWRFYKPSPASSGPAEIIKAIFCYNCAAPGHYGDDCPHTLIQPLLDGTAFSAAELPRGVVLSAEVARTATREILRNVMDQHDRPDLTETNEQSQNGGRTNPYLIEGGRKDREGDMNARPPKRPKFVDRMIPRPSQDRARNNGRDNWFTRRGHGSGYGDNKARLPWQRSQSKHGVEVPGSINLDSQSRSNRDGPRGFRRRVNAGKEAFKRLLK